jgi:hypothetical protein
MLRERFALSECRVIYLCNDGWLIAFAKRKSRVMHNAAVIVWADILSLVIAFLECEFVFGKNLIPHDRDPLIAIATRLLVVEARCVEDLVDDPTRRALHSRLRAKLNVLLTTRATDVRVASASKIEAKADEVGIAASTWS